MSLKGFWTCRSCGFRAPLSQGYYWRCPRCGSPLHIEFERSWAPRGRGVARYSSMLPVEPLRSLGEGSTPAVARSVGGLKAWFKLEYLNPTGSFKDRGTSLAIALGHSLGFRRVVEDTSGNTGISVAAYSSLYGMEATIVMPAYAPVGKKMLVRALGARVLETPTRGDAAEKVLELASRKGVFYVAHTWNPLYIEGAKTVAFEVYEDGFRGGAIVAPVGSGGLFLGIYRGFLELRELGLIDEIPRMIAVQGVSVAPLYRELYGEEPPKGDSTLADGIMVPRPPRLKELADAVRRTKGCLVLVDNSDIVKALKELLQMGFVVEPTSAAPYAAISKAVEEKCLEKGEEVLIPLTGSGLKTLDTISKHLGQRL